LKDFKPAIANTIKPILEKYNTGSLSSGDLAVVEKKEKDKDKSPLRGQEQQEDPVA
jgi:hypothetical protein